MPNYLTPSTMGFTTTTPIGYTPPRPNVWYPGMPSGGDTFGHYGTTPAPASSPPAPVPTVAAPAPAGGNSATGLPASTAAGNLAAGPTIESLSNLINSINQTAQQSANQGRIPNDPALEAQSSANIGSELSGQLPQDVVNRIGQAAAERGIATGSPGSDNSNASYLRDIGLTSLDLTGRGQTDLTRAVGRNPAAPIFDPTSQLLTPYQAGNLQNQANEITLQWAKALLGSGSGGGGGRSGGGGGYSDPSSQSNDSAWWNSLFPAGSAPGVPSAGGSGGSVITSTTNTLPGGSSYTNFNDPNWDSYFQDAGGGSPPNTFSGSSSSSYDPFSQYGDPYLSAGDTGGYNDPFNQEMFYSGF